MLFELTDSPIKPVELLSPQSGGFVIFEGRVRNSHRGRLVQRLEYEAYEELAVKEGFRLVEETKETFGCDHVLMIHRLGTLEVGEVAVWIAIAAPHRQAAFEACQFAIDELKTRIPIWKKEHYVDGDSGWINTTE